MQIYEKKRIQGIQSLVASCWFKNCQFLLTYSGINMLSFFIFQFLQLFSGIVFASFKLHFIQ